MSDQLLLSEMTHLHDSTQNRLLAREAGLNITTVTWEDTSRTKNSCWGSNISDLTLNTSDTRMPMIRKPNFSDVTGDLEISHLTVTVGNEVGAVDDKEVQPALRRIPLTEYLENLGKYAAGNTSKTINLALPRDEVILCSSQACILPLPEKGEVAFVPELFNYQSTEENPAVLAIVATSQGTSTHVITERQQKLLFNRHGQATKYLAKRLSQDRAERKVALTGEMTSEEQDRNVLVIYQIPLKKQRLQKIYVKSMTGKTTGIKVDPDETVQSFYEKTSRSEGIPTDQIRLVFAGKEIHTGMTNRTSRQWTKLRLTDFDIANGDTIHLVLRLRGSSDYSQTRGPPAAGSATFFGSASLTSACYEQEECDDEDDEDMEWMTFSPSTQSRRPILSGARGGGARKFGMEHAMLRAADKSEGPFKKIPLELEIERDERYPIRATFQFYRVTDDAKIDASLFQDIAGKIESVYEMAKEKGSLVIDTSARKTETTKKTNPEPLPAMMTVPNDSKPLFSGFSGPKSNPDDELKLILDLLDSRAQTRKM